MNELQAELEADHPELDIRIVGINQIGHESANALMTDGRSVPWLQDVDSDNNQLSDVWTEQWDVVYRDVIIVDAENTELGAFNLTTYNLADAETYAALREILIDVAADQPFWQNRDNRLDVNKDGIISAQGDVLPGINELNNHVLADSLGRLPALRLPPLASAPYIDVSGDGTTTAQADVLPIINFINNGSEAEGEFSSATQSSLSANSVPVAAIATGPVSVVLVSDWLAEDVSAQFVVPAVAPHDSQADASPSRDFDGFLAATADQRDDDAGPSIDRALRQESKARELNEEIDDLDELAADVAAIWSWE